MIVAVTAQGQTLASQVDERFGRAANFLLVNTEGNSFSVVPNSQHLNALQGAGVQAAQTVAATGAKAIITGHCGPKAYRGLKAAGMQVYSGAQGMTVLEAVEALKAGKLAEADNADVEGHWI